jgi:hypothetical protein
MRGRKPDSGRYQFAICDFVAAATNPQFPPSSLNPDTLNPDTLNPPQP